MRPSYAVSLLLAGLLGMSASSAHHSVAGQFDMTKPVKLKGVVSKVDWMNPHIYIHLESKEVDGKVVTWRLETVPTAMARKAGLTKAMLEGSGDTVTIDAFLARDGTSHLGYIIRIHYPDGRVYQMSSE